MDDSDNSRRYSDLSITTNPDPICRIKVKNGVQIISQRSLFQALSVSGDAGDERDSETRGIRERKEKKIKRAKENATPR